MPFKKIDFKGKKILMCSDEILAMGDNVGFAESPAQGFTVFNSTAYYVGASKSYPWGAPGPAYPHQNRLLRPRNRPRSPWT